VSFSRRKYDTRNTAIPGGLPTFIPVGGERTEKAYYPGNEGGGQNTLDTGAEGWGRNGSDQPISDDENEQYLSQHEESKIKKRKIPHRVKFLT